jgi:hypothetical protein
VWKEKRFKAQMEEEDIVPRALSQEYPQQNNQGNLQN